MQAYKKLLLSSGRHLSSQPRYHQCHWSAHGSRLPWITTSSPFSSSALTDSHSSLLGDRATTHSSGKTKDAFSDPSIMEEAKERWCLGNENLAPVVYPKGRPEIAAQIKKLVETRIRNGFAGQGASSPPQERRARRILDLGSQNDALTLSRPPSSSSSSSAIDLHEASKSENENMPQWMKHKLAIKKKLLGQAWNPQRKLTRQAMEEVRYLRKQFPEEWTTEKLARHFNVASESIVRILRSDYVPSRERTVEQDMIKEQNRKENVAQDVERIKAERHAEWLKRKEEEKKGAKQTNKSTARIRLGAPKRLIE
ncbi:MAG: Neugrin-domain-containing protein [Benniella sp.]|nr:MAG: Neugrin-domain-containing protein [Benniella sp.]